MRGVMDYRKLAFSQQVLRSLSAPVEKQASLGAAGDVARGVARHFAYGAVPGAAIGGIRGALKADPGERLQGAGRGALKGGLVGGAVGVAAGHAGKRMMRSNAASEAALKERYPNNPLIGKPEFFQMPEEARYEMYQAIKPRAKEIRDSLPIYGPSMAKQAEIDKLALLNAIVNAGKWAYNHPGKSLAIGLGGLGAVSAIGAGIGKAKAWNTGFHPAVQNFAANPL